MTFNFTAKDQAGAGIGNVLVFCNVLETGQVFMRQTDGNGYANLNITPTHSYPLHVTVYTTDPRFQNWLWFDDHLPDTDQTLEATLLPFV